jgi:sphinganine C4-monooxygenase
MDFVGAGIPSIILNMCPLTQCIFFTLLSLKTVSDHSGMFLPYDPFVLFKNNSRYHDIHHKIKNIKFNLEQPYFSFWDTIMSTEKNNPQSPQ